MQVRDLQHKPAATCLPQTPIADAARIMRRDNVGSVVVVDEHRRIAGIVTDRDIAIHAVADGLDGSTPVEKVMSRNVDYLYENADVFDAAEEMSGSGLRRLPVLDVNGNLTGVLSFDDLIVTLTDQMARLGTAVRTELRSARIP